MSPWFKVDDSFHAHPKVLATDPAALGLWVVAGAWSSAHLTEGRVPDQVLPRLLPDSATLARTLVAAGLWRKVRGGYQFHDWTDYNPTAKEVQDQRERRAAAGRKGGLVSAQVRGRRQRTANESATNGQRRSIEDASSGRRETLEADDQRGLNSANGRSKRQANASARASPVVEPPTRPLPSTKEGRGGGAQSTREPQCRKHQGQPAHNCALCRSEQLGGDP